MPVLESVYVERYFEELHFCHQVTSLCVVDEEKYLLPSKICDKFISKIRMSLVKMIKTNNTGSFTAKSHHLEDI